MGIRPARTVADSSHEQRPGASVVGPRGAIPVAQHVRLLWIVHPARRHARWWWQSLVHGANLVPPASSRSPSRAAAGLALACSAQARASSALTAATRSGRPACSAVHQRRSTRLRARRTHLVALQHPLSTLDRATRDPNPEATVGNCADLVADSGTRSAQKLGGYGCPDGITADDHRAVGARSRRRAVVDVRELRAVLASLSDVPGHRRGEVLTTRPNRCHAGGRQRNPADRRLVRRLHRDLRAVPGVRAGMPERGALRRLDGGDQNRAGNERKDHAVVATARVRRPGSPPDVARRVDAARRSPASASRTASARPRRSPAATSCRRSARRVPTSGCSPAV